MDVERDVEPHVERNGCCHCTPAKIAASVLAVLVIGKYITNIDSRNFGVFPASPIVQCS